MRDFRKVRLHNHSSYRYQFNKKIQKFKFNKNFHTAIGSLSGGFYCVRALETKELRVSQFRAMHLIMLRFCRDHTKFRFTVTFRVPLTRKFRFRMGTGKGKIYRWVAKIMRGDSILEIGRIPDELKRNLLFRILHSSFPIKIRIFERWEL